MKLIRIQNTVLVAADVQGIALDDKVITVFLRYRKEVQSFRFDSVEGAESCCFRAVEILRYLDISKPGDAYQPE